MGSLRMITKLKRQVKVLRKQNAELRLQLKVQLMEQLRSLEEKAGKVELSDDGVSDGVNKPRKRHRRRIYRKMTNGYTLDGMWFPGDVPLPVECFVDQFGI